MASLGQDVVTSVSSVAATLGNIGPGFGSVGPESTFSEIPQIGKFVLSFLMLMGRLELFTVMLCFTRDFGKKSESSNQFWRQFQTIYNKVITKKFSH